jgi:hypothetical protein
MRNTSTDPSTLPFIAPYADAMHWVDVYARAAEGWLDWNLVTWRQLAEMQAGLLRPWSDLSGWPTLPIFMLRGGEQLA